MKFNLIIFSILMAASVEVFADSSAINETKSKFEQWVKTRQLISKERNDWKADKEVLTQSISLLENELAGLDEKIADLEASSTQADAERNKLLLERTAITRANKELKQEIEGMETNIRKLIATFPDPLAKKLNPLIVRIPNDSEKTNQTLGQRLQNIVGILAQAEKFNKTATFVGEIREVSAGKKVQVNTIYWGLSFAVYSDNQGVHAGVGVPGEQEWTWTERNEVAADIKHFIDIYEGAVENIEFVSLPVTLN